MKIAEKIMLCEHFPGWTFDDIEALTWNEKRVIVSWINAREKANS